MVCCYILCAWLAWPNNPKHQYLTSWEWHSKCIFVIIIIYLFILFFYFFSFVLFAIIFNKKKKNLRHSCPQGTTRRTRNWVGFPSRTLTIHSSNPIRGTEFDNCASEPTDRPTDWPAWCMRHSTWKSLSSTLPHSCTTPSTFVIIHKLF